MAVLDWSHCPAVESIPGKVSGAWVFRGTRLPVATVIENLEDLSVEEVMEQFDVSREQIAAVLDFVAESLKGFRAAAAVAPRRCSFSLTMERADQARWQLHCLVYFGRFRRGQAMAQKVAFDR